ncbi:MAG: response regulator [Candidatus Verstraetearchaeota archaeon]|nr:response regulator [Candidatus Verstraetearchaeota archaeon]
MPNKILVVDDEPDVLNLAKLVLEGAKLSVITASNGKEALMKAEDEMPDLILLDIVMPGKSGLEVCKILKSQPQTRHIPVAIFTVLDRDVDRMLSVEAGADDFLPKPLKPEDLLLFVKRVKAHLAKAQSSQQLK